MAEVQTRADSLRRYLSGASSDGGVQTDPNLSLGNFRSSSEIKEMDHVVSSPISDITVDFVSSNNGTGAGTITAIDADTLAWTPPGGSQGPAVAILNGETKLLEGGGGEVEKYLRVSRVSATSLTGAATVTISQGFNNLFDDKSSAEQSAGDTDYRMEVHKNDAASQLANVTVYIGTLGTDQVSDSAQLGASGAGTITTTGSFADWPDSGYVGIYNGATLREIAYYESRTATSLSVPTGGRGRLGTSAAAGAATDAIKAVPGIRIAKEDPSGQPSGNFQLIGDENTPPTGITWSTPHTLADGIVVGTLATGNIYGIWIERDTIAGATSEPEVINRLVASYDAA